MGGVELAARRGVTQIFISLTHTDAHAVANALIAGAAEVPPSPAAGAV